MYVIYLTGDGSVHPYRARNIAGKVLRYATEIEATEAALRLRANDTRLVTNVLYETKKGKRNVPATR